MSRWGFMTWLNVCLHLSIHSCIFSICTFIKIGSFSCPGWKGRSIAKYCGLWKISRGEVTKFLQVTKFFPDLTLLAPGGGGGGGNPKNFPIKNKKPFVSPTKKKNFIFYFYSILCCIYRLEGIIVVYKCII